LRWQNCRKIVLNYQKEKKKENNQKCATRLRKLKKNVTLQNVGVFKFPFAVKLLKLAIGGGFPLLFTQKIAEKYS